MQIEKNYIKQTTKVFRFFACFSTFLVFFFIGPFRSLDGLKSMPGDLGDSRFLNYILEATHKYFSGSLDSIFNMPFFYPFPYVLGFSDHLFGSTFIYSLFRFFKFEPYTSFQLWYLISFPANFFACAFCLKKLQFNINSSIIGSVIFTFALPVFERMGHPQLAYRFGSCLAITYLLLYFQKQKPLDLVICLTMMVWQNACSLYIGFFTMIFVLILVIVFVINQSHEIKGFACQAKEMLLKESRIKKTIYILCIVVLMLAQFFIYYPYWKVANLYHISRSKHEIFMYLPQIASYFTSKVSSIYNLNINESTNLTCPEEKRMFFGFSTFLALIIVFAQGVREKNNEIFKLLLFSSIALIGLTLSTKNMSLWFLFMKLPIFSGIRVVARLDVVLLMPISILSAMAIENLNNNNLGSKRKLNIISILFLGLMLIEFSFVKPFTSQKKQWQERAAVKCAQLNSYAKSGNFAFFANNNKSAFWINEIDAMWAGLELKIPVMNGYSGSSPGGLQSFCESDDFNAVAKRFIYIINFQADNGRKTLYENLVKEFVPIGFDLEKKTFQRYLNFYLPSKSTEKTHDYNSLIAKDFSILVKGQKTDEISDWRLIFIEILNNSNEPLYSQSQIGHPIRLSYRFLNKNKTALSGWDNRIEIPFDIPSHRKSSLMIPIKKAIPINANYIEISIVQEGLFWFHQFGFQPCEQSLSNIQEINHEVYCFGEKI